MRLMGELTPNTIVPPARPPTSPEDPPAAAACWFVDANRRAWERMGARTVRAAPRTAILEAIMIICDLRERMRYGNEELKRLERENCSTI